MMKIDLNKVIFVLLSVLLSIILLFGMSGCSAKFHEAKFYKKGGQFSCDIDTLKIIDSIIVDGATKYIVRDSLVVKTDTKVVTRWQTKFKYKEVKAVEKTKQNDSDNNVKHNRIDSRQEVKTIKVTTNYYPWWKKVILFVSGIGITAIYLFIRGLFKMPLDNFGR